jgi:hypothetical protein
MRTAKQILDEARAEGRVWIEGELEFPFGVTCDVAYNRLYKIGCECGDMVSKHGRSQVYVYPCYDSGYYVLDWYDGDRPGPWAVTRFNAESARCSVKRENDGSLKVTD